MRKRRMIEVELILSASLSVTVPLFLNLVLQIHCLHHPGSELGLVIRSELLADLQASVS